MERAVVEELHAGGDLDRAFDLVDRGVRGSVGTFQRWAVFSWPPERTVRPSGLKATNQTWFSWRKAGPIGLPVTLSQSWAVRS